MRKKILIIGAVPHPDDLRTYGGTTTLMQNFIDYCDKQQYEYQHIDTLKYTNKILNFLHFGICFLWGIATSYVVMYNVARNGAFTLFYHTAPLCFALNRNVVFRMFGGNFFDLLEDVPANKKNRMLFLLNKTHTVFFETKKLIEKSPKLFKNGNKAKWFPNSRKPSDISRKINFRKRFVFISRVEKNKGIDHLIQVTESLPSDYTVDIYGPLDKEYADLKYFENKKAEYRGALKTEQVLTILAEYDVLVLPTCWETEGYPGIIIEAMSLGIPVIASRIGGIPEMVENGINGLLVEPHNEEDLRKAILSFNQENYNVMSVNSLNSFNKKYNSDVINESVYQRMMLY
ncbi:glycosyltransferase [Bacteroidales bacterium SW292]|nr:glycosyltransferase [Bacteroidales bacterium SW292]